MLSRHGLSATRLYKLYNERVDASPDSKISLRGPQCAIPITGKKGPTAVIGDLRKRLPKITASAVVIVGKSPDSIGPIAGRHDDLPIPWQGTWRRGDVVPRKQNRCVGIC